MPQIVSLRRLEHALDIREFQNSVPMQMKGLKLREGEHALVWLSDVFDQIVADLQVQKIGEPLHVCGKARHFVVVDVQHREAYQARNPLWKHLELIVLQIEAAEIRHQVKIRWKPPDFVVVDVQDLQSLKTPKIVRQLLQSIVLQMELLEVHEVLHAVFREAPEIIGGDDELLQSGHVLQGVRYGRNEVALQRKEPQTRHLFQNLRVNRAYLVVRKPQLL
mmetsp:Transcript_59683/g.146606  ORF Transcript_59683/g.146606 Transcript_59683/m.146606 type:complete len:220 (+) Transcript_59683:746-1405(+)